MNDIVPDLLKNIEQEFLYQVRKNEKIKTLMFLVESHKATYEEANEYAIEIGEALVAAFKKYIKSELLPDGRMYFNIGERILYPTLGKNFDMVSSFSKLVQDEMNIQVGIGLKSIVPEFNKARAKSLIDRLANELDFEKVEWILDEPIINFTHSIVNDVLQRNVEFQYKTGLKPTIKRTLVGGACDWCISLAGTYLYPDVPKDVYKRHDKCRCTVEYIPNNVKKQNVWSKAWD